MTTYVHYSQQVAALYHERDWQNNTPFKLFTRSVFRAVRWFGQPDDGEEA